MTTEQIIQQEAEKEFPNQKNDYDVPHITVNGQQRIARYGYIKGATFGASLNGWIHINGPETCEKCGKLL